MASDLSESRVGEGIELHDVSVRFGDETALQNVDLSIAAGERVGLVGPSGAGKTTLLRLLNGMLMPSEGTVTVAGADLATLDRRGLRALRARIGFVHQDLNLVPNLRASQNILAGSFGRRSWLGSLRAMLLPAKPDLLRAHALLERVGIPDKLFARTDRLSGGQQQRVAIARALFQQPTALLADEPVSSVDPARAQDTVELLAGIAEEESLTLCMSLHNLELARSCFPRLIGLRAGRVLFDRPSNALDDEAFRALYELQTDELLADGS